MPPLRKRPRRAVTSLLAAGAVTLAAANASAAVITWDNPGEGLWSDPTNWSGDAVPAAADDSRVNNGGTIVIDDTQAISSAVVGTADVTLRA